MRKNMAKQPHISRLSLKQRTSRPRRRSTATWPALPTRTTFNLCSTQSQTLLSPIIFVAAVFIRLILYSTLSGNEGGKHYHDMTGRMTFFSGFEARFHSGSRKRGRGKERDEERKMITFVNSRTFKFVLSHTDEFDEKSTLLSRRLWCRSVTPTNVLRPRTVWKYDWFTMVMCTLRVRWRVVIIGSDPRVIQRLFSRETRPKRLKATDSLTVLWS